MPSKNDDSPGTPSGASAGFSSPENHAPQAHRPTPDRWLARYFVSRLQEVGVNDLVAEGLADRMASDITAAFATLARLDAAGVYLPPRSA